MRPSIKKKWLTALRSGRYKKGENTLKDHNQTYCCLGVLCDVLSNTNKRKFNIDIRSNEIVIYNNKDNFFYSTASLSSRLLTYLDIPYEDSVKLMILNDNTPTFEKVISYIKCHL